MRDVGGSAFPALPFQGQCLVLQLCGAAGILVFLFYSAFKGDKSCYEPKEDLFL